MADFYTAKKLTEVMASHQQSVNAMAGAAKTLGDQGIRAVQLWAIAKSLVDEAEQQAAGAELLADTLAKWAENKANITAGIDSLAAASGKTRQEILDEIAAMPATNFA